MDQERKQKTYDSLIKRMINSDINTINLENISGKIDVIDFKKYLLLNCIKSSKKAQILPAVLFLIISLVSFSVVYLSPNLVKFWGELDNENLKTAIVLFGIIFIILSIVLFVQKYIFKTKIIFIYTGYSKGYRNISNKKYKEIVNYFDSCIITYE